MLSILITILQVVVYVSWVASFIYLYFKLKRDIRKLAIQYGILADFECKKCHTVHHYDYDTYLKIVKKVRNTSTVRVGTRVLRSKEYKYPCSACNSKQWQKMCHSFIFVGTECEAEHKKLTFSFIAKVFAVSIIVVVLMTILDKV